MARWFTRMTARLLGYKFNGYPGGKANRRERDIPTPGHPAGPFSVDFSEDFL